MKIFQLLVILFILAVVQCHTLWQPTGLSVHPQQTVEVLLGLQNRNLDVLDATFDGVSDPDSPTYRQFLSRDELAKLIGASTETKEAVSSFLQPHALSLKFTGHDDFAVVTLPVSAAEQLFGVKMNAYRHSRHNAVLLRSEKHATIPPALHGHVTIISGLHGFPPEKASHRRKPTTPSSQATPFSSNAPVWNVLYANKDSFAADIQVLCKNGQPTNAPNALCTDQAPAVKGFQWTATNVFSGQVVEASQQFSACASATSCLVPLVSQGLEEFEIYNVSIVTRYVDGSESAAATFYTPMILSPFLTPQRVADQYHIPLGLSGNTSGIANSQAVAEFIGQYYSPDDLNIFFDILGVRRSPVSVVGPNNATQPGDEASLDIQWLMAISQDVQTWFWSVGDGKYLLEWANELGTSPSPPFVHSISYGEGEAQMAIDYGSDYMDRCDLEFQKLGVRGLSIIVSSGDAGSTNVGHGGSACTPMNPQYPASSPFVTSVSATFLTPRASPICDLPFLGPMSVGCDDVLEVAVAATQLPWTTGGGFSNRSARPTYQSAAVSSYLSRISPSLLPPASMWNRNGRAYPDVSAVGHNLLVVDGENVLPADGTSASAPIFAGVIALLNDVALSSTSHAPLGFLNPLLYKLGGQNPGNFFDVTVGNNRCGDLIHPPHTCCPYGYQALQGFDPVTGWGSPNYHEMRGTLQQLLK